MKKNRLLSAVIAAAMCVVSMCSALSVSAEDELTYGTGDFYTLEQLFAMSDEEFMALDGAEDVCSNIRNVVKEDQEYWGLSDDEVTLNGEFKKLIRFPAEDYTANITEKKIAEVLGDETVFEITSPLEEAIVSDNLLTVHFREYEDVSPTEENIIDFARCGYCVRQIIDLTCISNAIVYDSVPNYCTVTGDVNIDTAVDIYDVIWIASDLSGIFRLTESQQKLGDVNEDGVCNLYDAIAIAETLI